MTKIMHHQKRFGPKDKPVSFQVPQINTAVLSSEKIAELATNPGGYRVAPKSKSRKVTFPPRKFMHPGGEIPHEEPVRPYQKAAPVTYTDRIQLQPIGGFNWFDAAVEWNPVRR